MPETPEKDPVVTSSVGGYLFIAAVLLLGSLAWALWQEFFGLRPWKDYERQFVARYSRYLHKEIPLQEQAEKDIARQKRKKEAELERQYTRRDKVLGRSGLGRGIGLSVAGLEDEDGMPTTARPKTTTTVSNPPGRRRRFSVSRNDGGPSIGSSAYSSSGDDCCSSYSSCCCCWSSWSYST